MKPNWCRKLLVLLCTLAVTVSAIVAASLSAPQFALAEEVGVYDLTIEVSEKEFKQEDIKIGDELKIADLLTFLKNHEESTIASNFEHVNTVTKISFSSTDTTDTELKVSLKDGKFDKLVTGEQTLTMNIEAQSADESIKISKDLTVKIKVTGNPYTVTFDANGGSGSMTNQTIEYDTETALATNAFTLTGYEFAGWNTAADGSGSSYTDAQKVTNLAVAGGTTTLYAQWEANEYTVSFDANDGTGTMADQTFTYDVEQALTTNTFTRSGNDFAGWNTAANGSGTAYANGASVSNLAEKGTVTLYAQWAPKSYTVTFDKNSADATGTMDAQSFTFDEAQALTANAFTLKGHHFTGWNTEADGSGKAFDDKAQLTATETGWVAASDTAEPADMTLYAQWEANEYAISFDANGGTGTAMPDQTFTYKVAAKLNANTYTRSGYVFAGWNTKADGSGKTFADKAKVRITTNVTLYAQWTEETDEKVTLTLDANGGTGTMAAVTVTKGTSVQLAANTFTRSGYTFKGWNTKADGSGTSFADEASVKLNADATLYAQWSEGIVAETYTVTFNANGGKGTMADQEMEANTTTALNANKFTRSGYTFKGWNTKKDGSGTSLADKAKVKLTADVTLYAQWSNTVTVTFNANGGTGTMAKQEMEPNTATALKANKFTRSGYTFKGWNTKADGSGTSIKNGAKIKISSDVTLYAQWTKKSGGSASKASTRKSTAARATKSSTSSSKLAKTGDPTSLISVAAIAATGVSLALAGVRKKRQ